MSHRFLALLLFMLLPATAAFAQASANGVSLQLSARFSDKDETIASGVMWRVFRIQQAVEGDPPLVAESKETKPVFVLDPGVYVVHAGYGLAATTKRIELGSIAVSETLVLNAGAISIAATVQERPIPKQEVTARIYAIMQTGERRLIAENIATQVPIRLPEGRYFVESTYGGTNASVSAELTVQPGKITQATFHHRAAKLTMKLVSSVGGEALANTAWSVLTPGGDVIREEIGAFPSLVLAEGEYVAVARHEGRVYQRSFTVTAGLDQDVEVIAQ